jgi:hypothetical protein
MDENRVLTLFPPTPSTLIARNIRPLPNTSVVNMDERNQVVEVLGRYGLSA